MAERYLDTVEVISSSLIVPTRIFKGLHFLCNPFIFYVTISFKNGIFKSFQKTIIREAMGEITNNGKDAD